MKKLLLLICLFVSIQAFSQKEMLVRPKGKFISNEFQGTKSKISFSYKKAIVNPSSLGIYVVEVESDEIVHYVKIEFYSKGKMSFDFLADKERKYMVVFYYSPEYLAEKNTLLINKLKIK